MISLQTFYKIGSTEFSLTTSVALTNNFAHIFYPLQITYPPFFYSKSTATLQNKSLGLSTGKSPNANSNPYKITSSQPQASS